MRLVICLTCSQMDLEEMERNNKRQEDEIGRLLACDMAPSPSRQSERRATTIRFCSTPLLFGCLWRTAGKTTALLLDWRFPYSLRDYPSASYHPSGVYRI